VTVALRLATEADADAVSAFARSAFDDWYAPLNDPEDMRLHLEDTFSIEKQAAEIARADHWYLLAEEAGRIVGYSLVAEQSPEASVTAVRPAQIKRFYLDRAFHGSGLATRLMEATLERVASRGADVVWLTAWTENPRAVRFYEKSGFTRTGEAVFLLGRSPQIDHVLARGLMPVEPS
jgi:diamine N-acetyltransferase